MRTVPNWPPSNRGAMTPAELARALAARGYSTKDFATALGVSLRAVYHWLEGNRQIPGYVQSFLELLPPKEA